MPALEIALLGRPQIVLHGQPLEMTSHKAQALLYYLVMSRQAHSRQALAGLLWTDMDEAAARRNLRVELLKVRNGLDDFFLSDRDTIAFDRATDHQLDVIRFEANLKGEPTFEQLEEATALYRGEFLGDFHVRDAPFFEEWVTNERERLWQMARQALLRLINHYVHRREYSAGVECANILLKQEPWSEEAHQQIMRLLALSGQRSAALAQYELCSQALYEEFGVPPSDETNALYDQIESGKIGPESGALFAAPTPAPAAIPAPVAPPPAPIPFQAPPSLLHFVGRAAELAAVQAQLLRRQPNRMVALVGMAGIGKTALADHLAHDLRDHFADGVLWAYTASTEPLDILGGWAQAYGYDFSGLSDVENRAAALRGALADKQTLIVLDDVRSLSRVRPLLVGGAKSATLFTTRDLDVATALGAHPYQLDEMTPEDGEQLLVRILGEDRVAAEREAAREICALLQNLPLAVEITAQRLLSRPRRRLADMAERLHNVQERLDLAISDRAVRTSFMVSWESLDSALRRTFALLGVFEGRSFAAPALADLAELDVYTTEDRLFALTALSLLNEEEEDRYRQHPLLADFAREQLGDDKAARQRMAAYYQRFAQAHQTQYAALQPEWENMMAGMRTAHTLQAWPLVLDYADTLTEPWFTLARYSEARHAYFLAKDAAISIGDERFLAIYLLRWGQACIEQDDYLEAEDFLNQCLILFERINDTYNIATVKYYLARIALDQMQYDVAETYLESSLQLRQQINDRPGTATTTYQKALLFYRRGQFQKAKSLCEWALNLQEEVNDWFGLLPTLRLLADIAMEQHDFDTAYNFCQRALELCNQLHNRGELAATYYSLTVVARCQGNYALAQSYAQKALALFQLIGDRGFQALMYYELSRIHAANKAFVVAIEIAEKSLSLFKELHESFNLVYVLRHLGDLHKGLGQEQLAFAYWQQALVIASSKEHPLALQIQEYLTQLQSN
jgi:DNA-binding SARP family transcriptional activator/tetratricopeptide (TPR) repeat protein